MRIRTIAKRLIERATGHCLLRKVPRGVDPYLDIRRFLPACHIQTVFDVGANVGETAREILTAFPAARLYAFEPVERTFRTLQQNLQPYRNVRCFNHAVGQYSGEAIVAVSESSERSFLIRASGAGAEGELVQNTAGAPGIVSTEKTAVVTLDEISARERIETIDFLKIDTEGADMQVLDGASGLLRSQRIGLVQVEAGMNARNRLHVPFEAFKQRLESWSYFLFGIYEQTEEWITREPNLRRADLVFISQAMIEKNSRLGTLHLSKRF